MTLAKNSYRSGLNHTRWWSFHTLPFWNEIKSSGSSMYERHHNENRMESWTATGSNRFSMMWTWCWSKENSHFITHVGDLFNTIMTPIPLRYLNPQATISHLWNRRTDIGYQALNCRLPAGIWRMVAKCPSLWKTYKWVYNDKYCSSRDCLLAMTNVLIEATLSIACKRHV